MVSDGFLWIDLWFPMVSYGLISSGFRWFAMESYGQGPPFNE